MASISNNRRSDNSETLQTSFKDSSNEILLFHNNRLLLKAERGVTLGLIKLIYSSDDYNSGIILGVKPRLINQVPCLVTFDSTILNQDAYDLIIKDSRSEPNSDTEYNSEQPNYIQEKILCSSNVTQHLSAESEAAEDVSFSTHVSSEPQPVDDLDSSDETLEGPLTKDTANDDNSFTDGDLLQDLSHGESENSNDPDNRKEDIEEENENEDSTLIESSEKLQFNPEEFDFDIKSVTPIQTDKGLRWPCDRCGKDYCSASHLKRHWILHTNFKPYKCKLCIKSFPFHWDLKRHMTKHTGNKRFKCPHCTKSFNTQKELKCHDWLHTGQKMYKCQICNHEISSSGNLKIHMRKHTGEKPYKCEYCPKAFYMLGHYQYHVRRHTGEKPYKCDVCGMAFSYSVNLGEHKNIHTGVKPYSCPTCEKKFTHRSTLKQHTLTHGGQRPYKCHLCPKNFVQSSNYRMHLLTHKDKQDRVQKCDLCGKELLSRRGVKKHRQLCVKKLIDRANGITERKVKTKKKNKERYECGVCSRLFTYRANYEAHCKVPHTMKKIKTKKVQMPKPTKPVSSRGRGGQVSCPICHKQFLYMKCIKKHLQKRHSGVEVEIATSNFNTASNRSGTSNRCHSGLASNTRSVQVSLSGSTSTMQNKPVTVQSLPTVHIQPAGVPTSSSSNVTLIYVPPISTQNSSTVKPGNFVSILPKPYQKSSSKARHTTVTSADRPNNPRVVFDSVSTSHYTISEQTGNDKIKGAETGSQAITALKILSAKVGIEDQFQVLSSRTDEHRQSISKHLSALEQLSKRVGVDGISVPIETSHNPKHQLVIVNNSIDQVNLHNGRETEEEGLKEMKPNSEQELETS